MHTHNLVQVSNPKRMCERTFLQHPCRLAAIFVFVGARRGFCERCSQVPTPRTRCRLVFFISGPPFTQAAGRAQYMHIIFCLIEGRPDLVRHLSRGKGNRRCNADHFKQYARRRIASEAVLVRNCDDPTMLKYPTGERNVVADWGRLDLGAQMETSLSPLSALS